MKVLIQWRNSGVRLNLRGQGDIWASEKWQDLDKWRRGDVSVSKTIIITILLLEDGLGTSDFTHITPNAITVQDSYPSSPFTEEETDALGI